MCIKMGQNAVDWRSLSLSCLIASNRMDTTTRNPPQREVLGAQCPLEVLRLRLRVCAQICPASCTILRRRKEAVKYLKDGRDGDQSLFSSCCILVNMGRCGFQEKRTRLAVSHVSDFVGCKGKGSSSVPVQCISCGLVRTSLLSWW